MIAERFRCFMSEVDGVGDCAEADPTTHVIGLRLSQVARVAIPTVLDHFQASTTTYIVQA